MDTGEVLPMDQLTEEQKKSGKWKPVPDGLSADQVGALSSMNRKDRRAAFAKQRKAAKKEPK